MAGVEPRSYGYCPAGCGSNTSRVCLPPRVPGLETQQPRPQPSPRAGAHVALGAHVASAPKWTYRRWAARHPDLPPGARGCGRPSLKICAAPATKRPSLQIAAAAVRCLAKLDTADALGGTFPCYFRRECWSARARAGGTPTRPTASRTSRAGWVAYLWCRFCVLPTLPSPGCQHPPSGGS
jgi:hypothetical protein